MADSESSPSAIPPSPVSESSVSLAFSRRKLMAVLTAIGIGGQVFHRALIAQVVNQSTVTKEMIAAAQWIADIELNPEEQDDIAKALQPVMEQLTKLRNAAIDADTVPAIVFRPDHFYSQATQANKVAQLSQSKDLLVSWSVERGSKRPSENELPFASVSQLASLLATKRISSHELTQIYLRRLEDLDAQLKCVVTLLPEVALAQAKESDQRRRQGVTVGVLDGIPWVAKDLIAIPPWKTTWGAEPFKEQVRDNEATVSQKLRASGAVLLAKVSLGALAWGDKWFGGMTRNPWNLDQGSSGSSAGSASAVAAGLTGFALGSETLGSIVSPCRRCRCCGLRPTYGRVSRAGCMPLAWTLDKIGPIARYVEDLAYIFPALLGTDGKDPSLVERSYQWPIQRAWADLRIGVAGDLSETEQQVLQLLQAEGTTIIDFDSSMTVSPSELGFVLGVEAAAVFQSQFRQDRNADYGLWTSTFLHSPFIPAIEYIQANRLRGQLIIEAEKKFSAVDVVLGGSDLLLTNLTGLPSLVVSCGTQTIDGKQLPGVIKLTASSYREEMLLHVGHKLQKILPPQPSIPF
ncbi:MAG: amidase [Planctomycetales bacterium]|nr:amidase [Planctomycetales bacterium]